MRASLPRLPLFRFGASQTQGQEGGFGSSDHLDVHRDVVLRLECMTSNEVMWQVVINMTFSVIILWSAIGLVIVQFKGVDALSGWNHKHYFISTVTIGALFLVALATMGIIYLRRLWHARQAGQAWSPRRKRLATTALTLILLEFVNLSLWVGSSAYQAASVCNWLAVCSNVIGYLQWTILNCILLVIICSAHDMCMYRNPRVKGYVPTPAVLVMDVGWSVHFPKLILWCLNQAVMSVTFGLLLHRIIAYKHNRAALCNFQDGSCHLSRAGMVTFAITPGLQKPVVFLNFVSFIIVYLIIYLSRYTIMIFFTLAVTLFVLMIPKLGSCWNYILIWLGAVPMHASLTQTAVGIGFAFLPENAKREGHIPQIWLQEFAWSEETKPACLARRDAHMRDHADLGKQPMFCMETCLKLLYWSNLIYDLESVVGGLATLETATSLYSQHSHELLWDLETDTKAVVAWGTSHVVVAFAGTSSMANVLTNLKVKAGRRRGFYLAYTKNDYNLKLMTKLLDIKASSSNPDTLTFLFTGHSLGGALATLAAHEFVQRSPKNPLITYTYGAPRVGTRSWANEYNTLIRDHFAIICDQDPVPRVPKGFSYKRVGERVVCDLRGNLMIRPSPLESSMWNYKGGYIVDHLLTQHRLAFASIIKAQFGHAALKGGMQGVEALAKTLDLDAVLLAKNCDLESLRDPGSKPVPLEVAARMAQVTAGGAPRGGTRPPLYNTLLGCIMCSATAGQAAAEGEEVVAVKAGPLLPLANEAGTAVVLPGTTGLVVPVGSLDLATEAVFDGHGGRLAADYLEKNLYNVFNDILKEDTISLTCSVKDLGDEDALTCGCTATTVLVHPDRLIVANVGDSRAVLSRGGEALVLSTEHRIPEDGSENEETARIRAAGGWVEDERVCGMLAVTRAFGDPEFKGEGLQKLLRRGVEEGFWTQEEADQRHFSADPVTALPDVTALVRTPDDEFLVVASDGLWDVLSSAEVLKAARQGLRKGLSLQAVADTLADRALRRHTYDNVAVVVVDMGGGRQGWKPQAKGLLRGLFSSS
ncbi:hypothetical protein APUTEX25_000681 [Auxenochlorella protothecoides]|uniref:PPM-type phosphatase domain-containing protein n=1 Tax=Auxenochlorella protothecoides TaxID=3075 RepID=A0A3M7KTI1_AUXPR|nr:hypothetical protein APUTEX25_000681 [Auxenochlorella protothecoides]|eukprot:RMZ52406.1 hypothetical protein APUTEX25_000681 [Auxenochlorella protothecoides]